MTSTPCVSSVPDHLLLDDLDRLGRRHDAAVAARRVLDHLPAERRAPAPRRRPASRTARSAWSGGASPGRRASTTTCVRTVATGTRRPADRQFVVQRLLQQVPDLALRRRVADVERLAVHLVGRPLGPEQRRADLRPVAVRHHQAEPVLDQADDGAGRAPGVGELLVDRALLAGPDERVAADGDECAARHQLGHQLEHDRLLGVQPVLGLLEHAPSGASR